MPSLTIRIGAAHWDATLPDGTCFDFSTMTPAERKSWYGAFGNTVWKLYGRNYDRWMRSQRREGGR